MRTCPTSIGNREAGNDSSFRLPAYGFRLSQWLLSLFLASVALVPVSSAAPSAITSDSLYFRAKRHVEYERAFEESERVLERYVPGIFYADHVPGTAVREEDVDQILRREYDEFCTQSGPAAANYQTLECTSAGQQIDMLTKSEAWLRSLGRELQAIAGGYEAPLTGYPGSSASLLHKFPSIISIWQSGNDPLTAPVEGINVRGDLLPATITENHTDAVREALRDLIESAALNGYDKEDRSKLVAAVRRYRFGLRDVLRRTGPCGGPNPFRNTQLELLNERWCDVEARLQDILVLIPQNPAAYHPRLRDGETVVFPSMRIEGENILIWIRNDDIGLAWTVADEPVHPQLLSLGYDGAYPECMEGFITDKGGTIPDFPAAHAACFAAHGGPVLPEWYIVANLDPTENRELCGDPFQRLGYLCRPYEDSDCRPLSMRGQGRCENDTQCDDGDPCTQDICPLGDPRACDHRDTCGTNNGEEDDGPAITLSICELPDFPGALRFTESGPNACGIGGWRNVAEGDRDLPRDTPEEDSARNAAPFGSGPPDDNGRMTFPDITCDALSANPDAPCEAHILSLPDPSCVTATCQDQDPDPDICAFQETCDECREDWECFDDEECTWDICWPYPPNLCTHWNVCGGGMLAPQEYGPDECRNCIVDLYCADECIGGIGGSTEPPDENQVTKVCIGRSMEVIFGEGEEPVDLVQKGILKYMINHELTHAQQMCNFPGTANGEMSAFTDLLLTPQTGESDATRCCAFERPAYFVQCNIMAEDGILARAGSGYTVEECADGFSNFRCRDATTSPGKRFPCSDIVADPLLLVRQVTDATEASTDRLHLTTNCEEAVHRSDARNARFEPRAVSAKASLPFACTPLCQTKYTNTIGNNLCFTSQCIEQSWEWHHMIPGRMPLTVQDEAYPWDACAVPDSPAGLEDMYGNVATPPTPAAPHIPAYRPSFLVEEQDKALCQSKHLPPLTPPILCDFDERRRLDLALDSAADTTLDMENQYLEGDTSALLDLSRGIAARVSGGLLDNYLRAAGRSFAELAATANGLLNSAGRTAFPQSMCPRNAPDNGLCETLTSQ